MHFSKHFLGRLALQYSRWKNTFPSFTVKGFSPTESRRRQLPALHESSTQTMIQPCGVVHSLITTETWDTQTSRLPMQIMHQNIQDFYCCYTATVVLQWWFFFFFSGFVVFKVKRSSDMGGNRNHRKKKQNAWIERKICLLQCKNTASCVSS